MSGWSVVVPTVGRPSLVRLLRSLEAQTGRPELVVVADDRPLAAPPLVLPPFRAPVRVVRSGGRGPAAARNAGWRTTRTPWVVFLDDDVVLPAGWSDALAGDLACDACVGAVQARVRVPLPRHRRPTDWERSTAGLETARWATADMAYRRGALLAVGGFDERFPRAYREDADLALRVRRAGWTLVRGERAVLHPVRPAGPWASLRAQRGTADDALLRALHGPAWREVTEAGRGRTPAHVTTVAAGALGLLGAAASVAAGGRAVGRGARAAGVGGAVTWTALTLDFTARRVARGPRPGQDGWAREWLVMLATSPLIPWLAVAYRARAALRHRDGAPAWPVPVRAVLFDRDGTLVRDVPYNGDPDLVDPFPGARAAVDLVRSAGAAVGLVTNQSGVARGLLTPAQVAAVNERLGRHLGGLDAVAVCPHGPRDGCACRKPAAGLVLDAAARLGVAPWECAVIGDVAADVDAAVAAGAVAVLVPNPATRADEVADAMESVIVAGDLVQAARLALARPAPAGPVGGPRPGPAPSPVHGRVRHQADRAPGRRAARSSSGAGR